MRIWIVGAILGCVGFGGCQSTEQQRGQNLVLDNQRCGSLGFAPGSVAMAQCMNGAGSTRAFDKYGNDQALAATNARIDAENAQRSAEFNRKMQEDQVGSPPTAASSLPSGAGIPGMHCSGSGDNQVCDAQ